MTNNPIWEVEVYIDVNLFFHSYTLSGLRELRDRGVIKLREKFGWSSPAASYFHDEFVILMRVRPYGHDKWNLVAYDLLDQNHYFCRAKLHLADIYFKSNYHQDYVNKLPEELGRKVFPGGLYFPVNPCPTESQYRSDYLKARLAPLVLGSLTSRSSAKEARRRLAWFPLTIRDARRMRLTVREYEDLATTPRKPNRVFFNARYWDPESNLSEKERWRKLGDLRVQIVKTLKELDIIEFIGGLRPNVASAVQHYPQLVFSPDPTHSEYMQLVASSIAVINTLGLRDCFAWKLPEYLVAGVCVLSQKLANELPQPLRDGEEILYFEDDLSDFVAKLQSLIDHQGLREYLILNTKRYYDKWVKPVSLLTYILSKATENLEAIRRAPSNKSETKPKRFRQGRLIDARKIPV